jgi:hypothetical protein
MHVVIVGDPKEAADAAIDKARAATAEIFELESFALGAGESVMDRIRKIAKHALTLAKAYAVIDSLACGACESVDIESLTVDDPTAN